MHVPQQTTLVSVLWWAGLVSDASNHRPGIIIRETILPTFIGLLVFSFVLEIR
jgi:hypothetical protein